MSDDVHVNLTREWTERVPIGMGLCPWAGKSLRSNRLRFVICPETEPSQVVPAVLKEADLLIDDEETTDCDNENNDQHAFYTTLLICPNVPQWNASLDVFDDFVQTIGRNKRPNKEQKECIQYDSAEDNLKETLSRMQQNISLVTFHPQFLRWRGLPDGIDVGITILAHKSTGGLFQKSHEVFPATILETTNRVFGRRRIKVQFHPQQQQRQATDLVEPAVRSADTQYVPVEWCVFDVNTNKDTNIPNPDTKSRQQDIPTSSLSLGPPLPDNTMHRSPYPTIHLIRNQDLARLRARDASRVKRKNAQRMAQYNKMDSELW
ncbi:DUF1415 domain containing protein [Nitzschia inconspicua]|uniref:DUF1415 domain containing protein n=1 Tax=Nitzschia inconspicua TaxID=303405 RepID=A0A9K3KSB7_9STRA|nr:DUF1415 domain containing protein [Nitzschia inconspicua]